MTATRGAVICVRYGDPADLEIGRLPRTAPVEGEVVVQVEAAGVGFADALMVQGTYQIKTPLPFVPGGDAVGVVAESALPGDELIGRRVLVTGLTGHLTEALTTARSNCLPLPDDADALRFAGFAQSFATARYALEDRAKIAQGDTVVVTGAGSGVGLAAVSLAARRGARVVAVASSEAKQELALSAGAADVCSPSQDLKGDIRRIAGSAVDIVVDVVGGASSEQLLRTLGFGGRHLVVGFASGAIPRLPANYMLLRNRSVLGVELGSWARSNPADHRAALLGLVDEVDSGDLWLPPATIRPWTDAARALGAFLARTAHGRTVLRFGQ